MPEIAFGDMSAEALVAWDRDMACVMERVATSVMHCYVRLDTEHRPFYRVVFGNLRFGYKTQTRNHDACYLLGEWLSTLKNDSY